MAMEEASLQVHCINQIYIYLKVYPLTFWNLLFLSGVLRNDLFKGAKQLWVLQLGVCIYNEH